MRKRDSFLCFVFLAAIVILSGCTGTSPGPATITVTPAPAVPVSSSSPLPSGSMAEGVLPSVTLTLAKGSPGIAEQSDYYSNLSTLWPRGDASNPSEGIDTILLYLDLISDTGAIDLTKMELVLSTNRTTPVIYRLGTDEAIGTFNANDPPDNGGNNVTSLKHYEGINVKFRVKPIPANTEGKITFRPLGGECTSASCEMVFMTPPAINTTNLL